ncbi:MAG: hypothetical protein J6X85_08495 [Ruminococcus sp.]|nr:hypothetical protein [Ruminococcus sp.]
MNNSKNEWERWHEHAKNHFKEHKAKFVFDNEDFTVIDWRNKDGRSDYYINFFVDKRRGSLHIDGDLGSSIATWYNRLTIRDLKSYIYHDVGYYMKKFQCTSDKYVYDEDEVFEDLVEMLDRESIDEYIETSAEFDNFDEFKDDVIDEICNSMRGRLFIPNDRLYEIATDIYPDAWEGLSSCGRAIDGRVYLWAIGFYMAVTQLEELCIL